MHAMQARKITTLFVGSEMHPSVVQLCMIEFLAAELQIGVPDEVRQRYAQPIESLVLMPPYLLMQAAANV